MITFCTFSQLDSKFIFYVFQRTTKWSNSVQFHVWGPTNLQIIWPTHFPVICAVKIVKWARTKMASLRPKKWSIIVANPTGVYNPFFIKVINNKVKFSKKQLWKVDFMLKVLIPIDKWTYLKEICFGLFVLELAMNLKRKFSCSQFYQKNGKMDLFKARSFVFWNWHF